jgi:hypothetical protein
MNSISKLKSLLVILCGGLMLFGCDLNLDHTQPAATPPPKVVDSGIRGQVLKGPVNAVPFEESGDGDSDYIGFAALFYVRDIQGQQVATFNSDASGWFTVKLEPGQYDVVPDASAPLIGGQQVQTVIVMKGTFSSVTLHFDNKTH